MKKILIALLLAGSLSTFAQSAADPGIGALNITDESNVSLPANNLVSGSTVLLVVPVQNLNETNALNNGSLTIKLGSALSLDPTFNLATAGLSTYFTWSYSAASKTITGVLKSAFPADQYGSAVSFKLNVGTSGSGNLITNFTGNPDENPINNQSTLAYNIVLSPLPVSLHSFTGKKVDDSVNLLKWITSQEKNFDFFEVQKSVNTLTFEPLGRVKSKKAAQGNLQTYEFKDIAAKEPFNYYRLKMVDTDGSFKYSNVVSIQSETEKGLVGEFFPNPAQDYAEIDVVSTNDASWTIKTKDLTGRVLSTKVENLKKGGNRLYLNTKSLATGLHVMVFENTSNGMVQTRKLLKQ
jgi:hypothetical protein